MNTYNPFTIEGKTIFVTGASSGIGKAIAIECSKMGAKLVITGRNAEKLNNTFMLLEGEGHVLILADLLIDNAIDNLIEEIPTLNGIVHCAGFTKPVPFQFVNELDLNEIMKVNFFSPTLITQRLLKSKKISKGASIVFISSISGVLCSYIAGSMYSASKGAINGLVKNLAIEFGIKSIRVNSVCPGMINTDILSSGEVSKEQLEEDIKKYPLKRYGEPEEVAHAVIYLLSGASSWVTGTNIIIDGGYTAL
jgi:NAD(P)-dependent dehydrogenase (short-subunit alcohol dehydrogenase family)